MRLALFSDLHLAMPFRWAPPEVARMRRQALRDTLDAIVGKAVDVGADALVCGGDLYEHDRVAPDTGEVIRSAFAKIAPMPVLVAPGNHDWFGPQSLYRHTEWSGNVHIFTEDRLRPYELVPGLTIWGAAHQRPAGTAGFLDGFRVEGRKDDIHLALFHGSLRAGLPFEEEGKDPHAPFDADQVPESGLHHALVGHFHIPKNGEWHTYPGNPDPLTFGEEGDRGVVVVDVQANGEVHRTRHVVAQSEVSDVVVDVTGCSSLQEVRERTEVELAPLSGTVRVTLEGEVTSDVDVSPVAIDGLGSHLTAVVPRLDRVRVGYDLDAIAEESTVRGQFVRDVLDAGMDPDLERRVLITGLRALEGRRDLEVV